MSVLLSQIDDPLRVPIVERKLTIAKVCLLQEAHILFHRVHIRPGRCVCFPRRVTSQLNVVQHIAATLVSS